MAAFIRLYFEETGLRVINLDKIKWFGRYHFDKSRSVICWEDGEEEIVDCDFEILEKDIREFYDGLEGDERTFNSKDKVII